MMEIETALQMVGDVYENKLPFNRVLGLEVHRLTVDEICFKFRMREDLVGNFFHGMLHGGVISAVLDATGGMTATVSILKQMNGMDVDEVTRRMSRVGTIDLRVDYLRPGKGEMFYSKGKIMRTGNRVAVVRMELQNQDDLLIAAGTGAYSLG